MGEEGLFVCQYCGCRIVTQRVYCNRCSTPHHRDCFKENGRCTTYGCGGLGWRTASETKPRRNKLTEAFEAGLTGARIAGPQTVPTTVLRARLLRAASVGQPTCLLDAIERGAPVSGSDAAGETALHKAAAGGHRTVVSLLLERHAFVDACDRHGATPLHHAAEEGWALIVRGLVKAGADVDVADHTGATPLHLAVARGRVAAATALLHAGAYVDAVDEQGSTPLIRAVYLDRTMLVSLLIRSGADPTIENAAGYSALSLAHVRRSETIRLLSRQGSSS